MLELANRTPFATGLSAWTDRDGAEWASVVVKGTYSLERGAPRVADVQVPVVTAPILAGEGLAAAVRLAPDLGPARPATDVVLLGNAWAPRPRTRVHDVSLRVGPVSRTVRVFGERRWFRAVGSWVASDPVEFERIPLAWQRAYGGVDATDPAGERFEPRNPAGTGFAAAAKAERLQDLPLPNLEDPRQLITAWNTRPPPAGLGFVAPSWEPRSRCGGTYDAAWERDRMPLLPADFDPRFHCAAPEAQQARPHLAGGEAVSVAGASRQGDLVFALPRVAVRATAWIRGQRSSHAGVLDTVVIEPDERRVVLVWRAAIPCTRRFLQLEAVQVTAEGVS